MSFWDRVKPRPQLRVVDPGIPLVYEELEKMLPDLKYGMPLEQALTIILIELNRRRAIEKAGHE